MLERKPKFRSSGSGNDASEVSGNTANGDVFYEYYGYGYYYFGECGGNGGGIYNAYFYMDFDFPFFKEAEIADLEGYRNIPAQTQVNIVANQAAVIGNYENMDDVELTERQGELLELLKGRNGQSLPEPTE